MADNEIIKALEHCKEQGLTSECYFDCSYYGTKRDCMSVLLGDALDLINRKKAEIEGLKNNVRCKIVIDDEKMERIKNECLERIDYNIKEIKAEAIKDFAERAKEKAYYCEKKDGKDNFVVNEMDIDSLVKEMVGDNDKSMESD